jgi:hypothetical protein
MAEPLDMDDIRARWESARHHLDFMQCCRAHDPASDVPELAAEVERLRSAIGAALGTVAELDDDGWARLGRVMGPDFTVSSYRDAAEHSIGRRLVVRAYELGHADCAKRLREAL